MNEAYSGLPRTLRSDTCNRHACDGLRELRSSATAAPQADWLFVMGARAEVLGIRLAARDVKIFSLVWLRRMSKS